MVLAMAAARLGSIATLTAGRSGSWEAADVMHLVQFTAGPHDEYLDHYRDQRPEAAS